MVSYYASSEREQQARAKLYEQVASLRSAVLDLLTLVRASDDPQAATTDMAWSETERLKNRIREIERQNHIIHRAREIIVGTKDSEKLAGKLSGSELDHSPSGESPPSKLG